MGTIQQQKVNIKDNHKEWRRESNEEMKKGREVATVRVF
jgi:hypothetical protein